MSSQSGENHSSVDPPTVHLHCVKVLTNACSNSFDLYEQQKGLEQLENTKKTISLNNLSTVACPDLEENYAKLVNEKTNAVSILQERVKRLQSIFVSDALDKLQTVSGCENRLDNDNVSSLIEGEGEIQLEPYENQLQQMAQLLETMNNTKSDKTYLNALETSIKQTEEYLARSNTEANEENSRKIQMNTEILDVWSAVLEKISSDEYKEKLKENIEREMLGLPSVEEENKELAKFEFSHSVQNSLSNFLRDKLLDNLFATPIYPKAKQKVPRKTLTQIAARSKAIQKQINLNTALFSKNFGTKSRKTFNTLTDLYEISRSQEGLMNFISSPNGETNVNHDKIPSDLKEYFPNQCNLYGKNIRLSSALATSIAQYTEKSFTDLKDRIAALEKKL